MKKNWVLMNPGPVNVTPRVRRALLRPDLCHREKEFSSLLADTRRRLLRIFGIEGSHTAAFFTGSGTAALEAMLSSCARKKGRILVLSNGVYGERMVQILKLHGAALKVLSSPLGHFPDEGSVERALRSDKKIWAVGMVHHETSTGMLNPLSRVARLAKKYHKKLLVDAVSSLGGEKIDLGAVDYCAGSAGKCLHGYPGLSFVILSKKEAASPAKSAPRVLYLDLKNTLKHQESDNTPFTPAVQLFYAFNEALKELQDQGLAARIRAYEKRSAMLAEGFERMGLRFLIERPHRSHVLTSLWVPKRTRYGRLHAALKKKGFIIYAGQSSLAGRIFRVSNLGAMSEKDIRGFLAALQKTLA